MFAKSIESDTSVTSEQAVQALSYMKQANDDPRIRRALAVMRRTYPDNGNREMMGKLFMQWVIVLIEIFKDIDAAAAVTETKNAPPVDDRQGEFQGIV